MNKKVFKYVALPLIGVVGLALVFCGSSFAYDKENPMIMRVGCINPAADLECKLLHKLGDMVEKDSDGRIKFQYSYSGSLFPPPQLVEAVGRGIGDIGNGPTAFARKVPALNIFSVYGSYRVGEWPEIEKAVEKTLDKIFVEQGVHLLMSWDSGSTLFDHKTKFLKSPEDWKGQKIRVPGRWLALVGEKWGASPMFMAPPELYLALQRGVIDGCMLPWHITDSFKIYEVAPFITHANFSNSLAIMPMNLKKWESLTKEDQAIFDKAIAYLRPWHDQNQKKEFAEIREDLKSKGVKIYDLTAAEMAEYLKEPFAQWSEVRKESGPLGNELADILMNYRYKIK